MDIRSSVEQIASSFNASLSKAHTSQEVEAIRLQYLGKKGVVAALMEQFKHADAALKPELGRRLNELKTQITSELEAKSAACLQSELNYRLEQESLDITLPGRRRSRGMRHVVLKMLDEVIDIFVNMGFTVQYGPDIDTDYYNFEALNFAVDHPARDMHDTFYITSNVLLRTHTSNTQVRIMAATPPPIRVIIPGKCYRNEEISARSHVTFHQIEGVYIAEKVSFADLLNTLDEFLSTFFKSDVAVRFRPSYFPFVEPGVEVDVGCLVCDAKGCAVCKHSGWLEVMGAGMIHPEVMRYGGIDGERYMGYAFGLGIERLAMLRYAIDDIRLFFDNNLKFLEQF